MLPRLLHRNLTWALAIVSLVTPLRSLAGSPAGTGRNDGVAPPQPLGLAVFVGGEPAGTWAPSRFANIAPVRSDSRPGWPAEAWSLRELAAALLGPECAATEVRAATARVPIPTQLWDDAEVTPVLRVNRRGQWKFEWLARPGAVPGVELREVTEIHFTRAAPRGSPAADPRAPRPAS